MEEMKIQQKVFEMMEYAYVCLQQFPKSEKFALVVDIKRCMNLILERVVEGSKKYYKKTTLQELDVEVTKLKALALLPASATASEYEDDHMWMNNGADERAFYSGGDWYCGAGAGLFALGGNGPRSYSYWYLGFRSAYVALPTE